MLTGGLKGKSREVDARELREQLADLFELAPGRIVSEYGMTELGSQAYDDVLAGGASGVYKTPPWMRVRAVNAESLEPLGDAIGVEGLARIEDLTNVDSAVAIQTSDRIRIVPGGVELLGRQPGADARGCSIGIDELLQGRGG